MFKSSQKLKLNPIRLAVWASVLKKLIVIGIIWLAICLTVDKLAWVIATYMDWNVFTFVFNGITYSSSGIGDGVLQELQAIALVSPVALPSYLALTIYAGKDEATGCSKYFGLGMLSFILATIKCLILLAFPIFWLFFYMGSFISGVIILRIYRKRI